MTYELFRVAGKDELGIREVRAEGAIRQLGDTVVTIRRRGAQKTEA